MKLLKKIFLLFSISLIYINSKASILFPLNIDTVPTIQNQKNKNTHSPKLALKRSAMLPGWGQIYNKQVWKVPIIYAGLGITSVVFAYNLKTYKDIRFAYNAKVKASRPAPVPPLADTRDSSDLPFIKDYLVNLDVAGLRLNRQKFRQQIDYSVLFFILFWGLNCADAVVFAHLKNFDVSDNLSGSFKIGRSNIANTNGIQLNFDLHKKKGSKAFVIP